MKRAGVAVWSSMVVLYGVEGCLECKSMEASVVVEIKGKVI